MDVARRAIKRPKLKVLLVVDYASCRHQAKSGSIHLIRHSMEWQILHGLRHAGFHVEIAALGPDILDAAQIIKEQSPDVIFNLTEEYRHSRRHDADIAGYLELIGIPYTGSGPCALQLSRDKALSKLLVKTVGVRVPRFFTVEPRQTISDIPLQFPLLVKHRFADSSERMTRKSLVYNRSSLLREIKRYAHILDDALICEEFIEGRELYVSILGNKKPRVLPPIEVNFGRLHPMRQYFTERLKFDKHHQRQHGVSFQRAKLARGEAKRIFEASIAIYKALALRDYARLDFRISGTGEIFFLEANPNCALTRGSFGRAARFGGLSYSALLARIVELARRRRRKRTDVEQIAAGVMWID